MPAPQFQISKHCQHGGCVAVAILDDGTIAVRDDKSVDGPILSFTAHEWDEFIASAKDGEFDRRSLQQLQHVPS